MIFAYAFYREDIESLMKALSKQARMYFDQNKDMIGRMKSLINYEFRVNSQIDLMCLQKLDLSNIEFKVIGLPLEQEGSIMSTIKVLQMVKKNHPTSNLSCLSLTLKRTNAVHYVAFLSRFYYLKKLEIKGSSSKAL